MFYSVIGIFKRMHRLLMLVGYDVVLLLTVEILGRTSMEISFCCLSALSNSTEISSGCFSASPHLYLWKFKRMALLLRLVQYDVAFLITSVENFSSTSTENSSSTFSYFLHLCRQKFETMNRLLSRTINRSKIAWVTSHVSVRNSNSKITIDTTLLLC